MWDYYKAKLYFTSIFLLLFFMVFNVTNVTLLHGFENVTFNITN
jgi:hypothetical protein